MGVEAAVAAALAAGALQPQGISMGAAVSVAVAIGSWNYYVQKTYPVPDVLIERADVLKYRSLIKKGDSPSNASEEVRDFQDALMVKALPKIIDM
jgi:hypothetical protein